MVYGVLHLMQRRGWVIRSVFHNFSLLGLISVEHCPIDLVVVTDAPSQGLFLFQCDGQYVHGCPTCPDLGSYVGGQSLSEVRQKQRNEMKN